MWFVREFGGILSTVSSNTMRVDSVGRVMCWPCGDLSFLRHFSTPASHGIMPVLAFSPDSRLKGPTFLFIVASKAKQSRPSSEWLSCGWATWKAGRPSGRGAGTSLVGHPVSLELQEAICGQRIALLLSNGLDGARWAGRPGERFLFEIHVVEK